MGQSSTGAGRCDVLLFSTHLNVCASHYVLKPEVHKFWTPMLSENGTPFPAGGRPENDVRRVGSKTRKCFAVDKVDYWFRRPKTNVFCFFL